MELTFYCKIMRIVFMGSPDFAIPSLEKIYQSNHQLAAVVSNKDKRRGRGGKKSPTAVKAWAEERQIPIVTVEDPKDPGFALEMEAINPDLIVVVAFRILPEAVLEIPSKGSINLHASLLPKYRGAAPIHWAVINGEAETGCTVFFLKQKVDTGDIIKQQKTPIGLEETTGDVYNRLKQIGADLLLDAVNEIAEDRFQTIPQEDEKATPAPKLYREDCLINPEQPAEQVHNKIRGLSPFPTAYAWLDGQKFNLYRSKTGPDIEVMAGQLTTYDDRLLLGCSSGTVELLEVQLEGRKRVSGSDFVNGYNGPMNLELDHSENS